MYIIGNFSDSVHQYHLGAPGYSCQFTTQFVNSVLDSVVTTIPSNLRNIFITPLLFESLIPGDNITVNVSLDNGSTWTNNIPINTWRPITSTPGTQMIIRANLITGNGTTTPIILGWNVNLM